MKSYILINTEAAQMDKALRLLSDHAAIKSVEAVSGPYDLIAVVEATTMDDLGRLLVQEVQAVPGVVRTTTCLVLPL